MTKYLVVVNKDKDKVRVLPRKNPQSGTRFDKVCHIAELEGIMLEGIYGNYYYRGNKFILVINGCVSFGTDLFHHSKALLFNRALDKLSECQYNMSVLPTIRIYPDLSRNS